MGASIVKLMRPTTVFADRPRRPAFGRTTRSRFWLVRMRDFVLTFRRFDVSTFPRSVLGLALLASITMASSARGAVEVNVTRVGFPSVPEGFVVRPGMWTPVVVDVDLVEQQSFDGQLRVVQLDPDGDQVHDGVEVHLRADSGGARRLTLYALPNLTRSQGRVYVELISAEGEAVQVLSQGERTFKAEPAQQPSNLSDDDILVLSVSSATIGRVEELTNNPTTAIYARSVRVAHLSPQDLPEHWIGLEAVDHVVWDNARAEDLTQRQLEALLTWSKHGGTLLIAASTTASSLSLSPTLHKALPADLGELVLADNLFDLRRTLLGQPKLDNPSDISRPASTSEWYKESFPSPIPVVKCTLRSGARSLADDATLKTTVVSTRRLGRGRIIFSGVCLSDLFSGTGTAPDFFQKVFGFVTTSKPEERAARPQSLFGNVISAVNFAESGSRYLLAAFAFSVAYLATATGGVWWFLGKRGWRHHSWSAFAVVATVASVFSVVAVNAMHGLVEKVHQISVIDLDSGQAYGYGVAYFGLKTPTDRELDVWMPSDPLNEIEPTASTCFLRPLRPGDDNVDVGSSFADPQTYRVQPATSSIGGVRVRATLKQFEGRWEGPVGGSISGKIVIRASSIQSGSVVSNNLGVDLKDCYLLYAPLNAEQNAGYRSASTLAVPIGDLPATEKQLNLLDKWEAIMRPGLDGKTPTKPWLRDRQQMWSEPLRGLLGFAGEKETGFLLGQEQNALLLASTLGEFDPTTLRGFITQGWGATTWSADRLRQLDLRAQLTDDAAWLVGFAADAGPIRLARRTGDRPFRPLAPDARPSWTMYRVRLPVVRVPGADPAESKDPLDRILGG